MKLPLSESEAQSLNALKLAYIGDAVYSLFARLETLEGGTGVRGMHLSATSKVNASAQAETLAKISGQLTQMEQDIVKRGRNAHPRHPAPRSASSSDYSASTGFEALMGYLYLTGRMDRIDALMASGKPSAAPPSID